MSDKEGSPEAPGKRSGKSLDRRDERRRRSPAVRNHKEERAPREERNPRAERDHNGRREPRDDRRQDERIREKDRDREHKRKRDPPSPPHIRDRDLRERRLSPRLPGPGKRPRRGDEYEGSYFGGDLPGPPGADGRRFRPGHDSGRLPRGGNVMDDGGPMRQPRGRSGWPGGRSTGFSDAPHGPGMMLGRGPPVSGPPGGGGMVSYKQFMLELEDDVSPADAIRRYEEYKAEYMVKAKQHFFEQHKEEDWLRNAYDPERLELVWQKQFESAQADAKEFFEELQRRTVDFGPTAKALAPLSESMAVDGKGEEEDVPRRTTLVSKGKRLDAAVKAAPKAPAVASETRRIAKDIDVTRALAKKLDVEKGIEGNLLTVDWEETMEGSDEGGVMGRRVCLNSGEGEFFLVGVELLDAVLTYLWRIHSVDYYGVTEGHKTAEGLRHVRAVEEADAEKEVDGKDWEDKLNGKWQARLQEQDPLLLLLGRERLEAAIADCLEASTKKIRDEKYGWKYGCRAEGCTKVFHGPEFVHKHIRLKHENLIAEFKARVREEIYMENYLRDPQAVVELPVANGGGHRHGGRGGEKGGDRGVLGRLGPDGFRTEVLPGPPPGDPSWLLAEREGADRLRRGDVVGSGGGPPLDRGGMEGGKLFERNGGPGGGVEEDALFARERSDERFERGGRRGRERERYEGRDRSRSESRRFDDVDDVEVEGFGRGGRDLGFGRPLPLQPFEGGMPPPPFVDDPFGPPVPRPPGMGPGRMGPPPMFIPVPGAGPMGPFMPAPPEVALRFMRDRGMPHAGFFPPFFSGDGDADGGDMRFEMGRDDDGDDRRHRMHRRGGRGGPRSLRGGLPPILDTPPPPFGFGGMPPMMRQDPRGMRSYKDLDVPEDEVTVIDYRSL